MSETNYGIGDDQVLQDRLLPGGKIYENFDYKGALYSTTPLEKLTLTFSNAEGNVNVDILAVNPEKVKATKTKSKEQMLDYLIRLVNTKLRHIVLTFNLDTKKIVGTNFKGIVSCIIDQLNKLKSEDTYNIKMTKNKNGWATVGDVPFIEIYKAGEPVKLAFTEEEKRLNLVEREYRNSSHAEDDENTDMAAPSNVENMSFEAAQDDDNPFK